MAQMPNTEDKNHKFGNLIENHLKLIIILVILLIVIGFAIGGIVSYLLLPIKID